MWENKKLFRDFKKVVTSSIFYIVIIIVFLYISDKTPYKELKSILFILAVLLINVLIILEIYKDAKSNEYTTKHFIILTRILQYICFLTLTYLYYKDTQVDTEILFQRQRSMYIYKILMISCILSLATSLLKKEKFKKES